MSKLIFSNAVGHRLLRHFCFWCLIFVWYFLSLAALTPGVQSSSVREFIGQFHMHDYWIILRQVSRMFITLVPSCYILAYWLVPRLLTTGRYRAFVFWCVLLTLVNQLGYFVSGHVGSWGGTIEHRMILIWYSILMLVNVGAPIVFGLFMGMKMLRTWSVTEHERAVLIRENASAELQLLKAQVRPHFLFNALNNIYSFSLDRSPMAFQLVSRLSNIVEYMTSDCNPSMVQLEREIKLIRDYVDLEKVRYGTRLRLDMCIELNHSDRLLIPPLLLIPFVENSFKHGASESLSDPWIDLQIGVINQELFFNLINGQPDTVVYQKPGKGLGLRNVRKRLELLFPNKEHVLTIVNSQRFFQVTLKVPLVKKIAPEEIPVTL